MKILKYVLLVIGLIYINIAYSQDEAKRQGKAGDSLLSKISAEYIIVSKAKNLSGTYTERSGLNINWGTKNVYPVKGTNGAPLLFVNGLISVINFMAYNGWEYIGLADDWYPNEPTNLFLFHKKR